MEAVVTVESSPKEREKSGLLVKEVIPESPAWESGVKKGDRIISINGAPLRDLIDLEFFQADSEISLEILSEGRVHSIEIVKDPDLSLGLVVDPPPIRRCPNDCEFCFVDQMPEGARKTLYIRDEDYRYSFLYGNFITLTNLTEKDYQRILEQRLSPLYVSVHATPLSIRRKILKNERAPDVLPLLRRLTEGGITVHTQIVLTPGVNDGDVLQQTWKDLMALYPGVGSLAVVPVGLTSYRTGLANVPSIDRTFAKNMIHILSSMQKISLDAIGDPFIFPADEWYVITGGTFPSVSRYGSLPQLGNGVGLVPLFQRQWKRAMRTRTGPVSKPLILVTGKAFASYLQELVNARIKMEGSKKNEMMVLPVENHFFGSSVTVAGLLSARDILAAVEKAGLPDDSLLCIPDICLKDDSDMLIDDATIGDIGRISGFESVAVPSTGREFWRWVRENPDGPWAKEASA